MIDVLSGETERVLQFDKRYIEWSKWPRYKDTIPFRERMNPNATRLFLALVRALTSWEVWV